MELLKLITSPSNQDFDPITLCEKQHIQVLRNGLQNLEKSVSKCVGFFHE